MSTYSTPHKPAAHGVTNHVGETSLSTAMEELHKQHPQPRNAHTDDRGPYHSSDEFCRHIPVVKKGGAYSR